jgi:peptide/nickel transport system substrate-binding protein
MTRNDDTYGLTAGTAAHVNRRRFIKLAALASGSVSLASLLAACGGSSSAPTATPGAAGATTAPTTTGSTAATAPAATKSAAGSAIAPTAAVSPVAGSAASPTAAGAAATGGTPKKGGTLTVALGADVIGLDPHGASSGVDRNVYTVVYNGLIAPDKNLKIVPDLAESWTTPDSTTYLFKLRPGIKFHDGTDCDAAAVKKNFDYILDPANASPRKPEIDLIQEVTAPDPLTVKIALKSAFAPFLSIISDRAGYIVSPTARAKFGKDYIRNPVGTGPYQFVEWVKDDHISFKRFDGYFEKNVAFLDQIVYKPIPDSAVALTNLKTGSVDFLQTIDPKDIDDIKATKNLAYLEGPGVGYTGLWINTAKGPLATKALREAVSLAVDREELLAAAYFGTGAIANGPIPPSSWAYDASVPIVKRDVKAAKAKLAEGGQPSGFKMVLKGDNTPLTAKIAQLVQAQLKEAGIDVQIQVLEFGALLKAGEQNDFDVLSLGWSGRIDPDGNIEPIFQTKGAFNYGKYSTPEIDNFVAQARQVSDQAQRKAIYQQLTKKINDDVAYIFTRFTPVQLAAGSYVKGFEVTPDGLARYKTTWLSK